MEPTEVELSWAFFLLGALHPSHFFTYLSFSLSLCLPFLSESRIPLLFPSLPLTWLLSGPPTLSFWQRLQWPETAIKRAVGRGYAVSPLVPLRPLFPSIWQTVYIFHRLEILFARSVAKLSRFEIFMNGSRWGAHAWSLRRPDKEELYRNATHLNARAAICRCCQSWRSHWRCRYACYHELCPVPYARLIYVYMLYVHIQHFSNDQLSCIACCCAVILNYIFPTVILAMNIAVKLTRESY